MKNVFFLLTILFILQNCKTNNSKNNSVEKTVETAKPVSQKDEIKNKALLNFYFNISEDILPIKGCLDVNDNERSNRMQKLINKTTKNSILFSEPCNGGSSQLVEINPKKHILTKCTGGPGCNLSLYVFENGKVTLTEKDAIKPNNYDDEAYVLEYNAKAHQFEWKKDSQFSEDTKSYGVLKFKSTPKAVTSYVKNTLKFTTDKLHTATIDLNNDGTNEHIFYITDMEFCGSGGCTFFILNNDGTRHSRITVANAPIYVSNETTNGYRNLITFSDKNWQQLTFDGKKYTSNASMGTVVDKPTLENTTLLFNVK